MCSSRRSGRSARRERCVMSRAVEADRAGGRLEQPERRSCRPSTCRCPTRRPGRASRPARARARRRRPRARPRRRRRCRAPTRKCLTRPSTSSTGAASSAVIRGPGMEARDEVVRAARSRSCGTCGATAVVRARAAVGERAAVRRLVERRARARGSPAAARSRAPRPAAGSRRAAPIVYGCCGRGEQLVRPAPPRPCGRRT